MKKIEIAKNINILGRFCGKRDVDELTKKLFEKYGMVQVDVMVLFGGSILAGGDILAKAMKNKIAKNILLLVERVIQQKHYGKKFIKSIQKLKLKIFQKQKFFNDILV